MRSVFGPILSMFRNARESAEQKSTTPSAQEAPMKELTYACPYHRGLTFQTIRGLRDHMRISHPPSQSS